MATKAEGTNEKKNAPVNQNPKQPRLIYVGPNLGNGRLAQYTVFKEGIPKHLDDVVEKYPLITELFVPVPNLAVAQAKIATVGSLEYQAYQSVLRGVE